MKPRPKLGIPSTGPKFGFGYECPVVWKDRLPGLDGRFAPAASPLAPGGDAVIELNASSPLWERIEAYGHEVVHAAIDFERWLRKTVAEPMKREAEETGRVLKEDSD